MRAKMSSILALILLMLTTPPLLISADTCYIKDQQALLAIKAHFGNIQYFSSWTPTTSCCGGTWVGVGCSGGRVTDLSIINANVSGGIPLAFFDLPYLKTLVLKQLPGLYGLIHHQLNLLTNLTVLTISHTTVEGSIPSDLFYTLTELTQLDLSYNGLYGPLPGSLTNLNNLFYIDLSGNQFRKTLPLGFFSMSRPPYLKLASNRLQGSLPADFANLDFIEIDLSGNRFVGDASLLFNLSKPTQKISLAGNQFRFDLSKVKFPQATLTELDLSHNLIYGKIPLEIIKVKNLESFNVSFNNLCGTIPTGGPMGKFGASSYSNNKCLCGSPLSACK